MNAPSAAETAARLDALAAELAARGWATRLHTPPGRLPSLLTCDLGPGATASEHVYAQPRANGTWTYWWPWAEPIAESAADAATIIAGSPRPAQTRTN